MKSSIKIILTTFLSIGFAIISYAGYLDDWTDDQICGWMDNASPPEYIVDEAIKRNLDCAPESAKKKAQEDTGLQIMIFDADFSESDLDELTSTDIKKSDFNFSKYELANNHKSLQCQFELKEVLYEISTEGQVSEWNIASGYLTIDSGKVNIDVDKGSSWHRKGLSTDPSYLRDEVNLRLTEDGYLVGKMAYFEWVGEGEVPKSPFYVELIKHKKSKPLNYKNPKRESAALWIDVNDWSDGVLYLNDCILYEANYKDGRLDGKKTILYENGQIKSEENYKDVQKEGKSTSWYQNGQIKSEIYHNKLEGKKTTWHQNGEIKSEINYKDDKREGVSTTWYQSGEIKSEINYKNGKKEGKSTVWYQSGQKKSEANYKDNTTDGKRTMWYENGQKKSEGNYKAGNAGFTVISGLKEGKFTTWYENGQKKSEENYIDNKREGKRTTWYENGQIMYKDNFKDGKLDGIKINWYKNGQVESEKNYKDGFLTL